MVNEGLHVLASYSNHARFFDIYSSKTTYNDKETGKIFIFVDGCVCVGG